MEFEILDGINNEEYKELEPYKCFYCGKELTSEEFEEWQKSAYCCSGYDCGCMGRPTKPPSCSMCIVQDY